MGRRKQRRHEGRATGVGRDGHGHGPLGARGLLCKPFHTSILAILSRALLLTSLNNIHVTHPPSPHTTLFSFHLRGPFSFLTFVGYLRNLYFVLANNPIECHCAAQFGLVAGSDEPQMTAPPKALASCL